MNSILSAISYIIVPYIPKSSLPQSPMGAIILFVVVTIVLYLKFNNGEEMWGKDWNKKKKKRPKK